MNTKSFSCVYMKLFPSVRMVDGEIAVIGSYGITPTEKQRALGEIVGILKKNEIFYIVGSTKEPNPSEEYKEYVESRLTKWLHGKLWVLTRGIRGKITVINAESPGDTLRLHDESVEVGSLSFFRTISEGGDGIMRAWRVYVEPIDEIYVEPIVPD